MEGGEDLVRKVEKSVPKNHEMEIQGVAVRRPTFGGMNE